MNSLQGLLKPSTIILSILVIGALLYPIYSHSIDWGAGHGAWVITPAATGQQSLCVENNEWCREWCNEVDGSLEPTGQFCCIGPDGVCNAGDIFF